MINYRAEIAESWVQSEPSARALAALLDLDAPVGLRDIVDRLHVVEEISVTRDINTSDGTPINGHVAFVLRSDGSSVFSGHMRATGAPSYDFAVQAWVTTTDGSIVAAQQRDSVYGTDTPGGDRQVDWSQAGNNGAIGSHWRSLRASANIDYKLHAEIGGVLGTALDVLEFAVKGLIANAVIGPEAWVILIGDELAGMEAQLGGPVGLAGIVVGGATLLLVGPAGLVPAIVEGAATVSLLGVEQRPLKPEEITFAMRVFGGSIDYDRIVLTNLTHPTDPGRRFTFPSIGKSITVNLGQAPFDKPTEYTNADYPAPGQLFIHELVHAWQFTHHSLFDMLCNYADNYVYFSGSDRLLDPSWQGRSWNGFKVEQQANIVDDWFEAHQPTPSEPDKLESFGALNDPAFRFIRDDIRNQIP